MSTFAQRELDISNKSYTNKDFEAIYLELLSIAEKISTRFSPTSANEADPFIILLKLVAAVADKVNYNVDKNILERFLLSCTQEKSMRELTEMLGYTMKYYNSAETSVVFKFNFNSLETPEEGEEEITEISIPAYSIVTNGDSIQYITLENATISKTEGVSKEISVIQGKLKELTVLGSNIIQLENLNANNRLYLPEVMIAQNGVSVNNTSSANAWQSWTESQNLNTETYGTMVYKFGFDSVKNLPYLDFPTWISEIIGDGLSIKYLITDGSAGNVAARGLTTVSRSAASDGIDDGSIVVINASAATSGCEPESISQAYKGFKKIIGTFDTLVTCRDYANKIYNLLNHYGNHYVSNVQVGDRRTDLNYACEVITASDFGSQAKSKISNKYDIICNSIELEALELNESTANSIYYVYDIDKYYQCKYVPERGEVPSYYTLLELTEDELKPVITPYDICIYGLKNIANTTYLGVDDANGYNTSYTLVRDEAQLNAIQNHLESCKTMPHVYKDLNANDIGFIRNDYKLDATVNTAQKVNILEQSEILININNALISKYNPRNMSFGTEISFDELLSTIEKADSRIKSVSLQEPEQTPKIIMANNQEIALFNSDNTATDQFKFIVAKNILSGRVEVFKYDSDFDYTYTQKDARKYKNVMKAITECNIPAFPVNRATDDQADLDVETAYTLNENETIQFLAPVFKTALTYPYGINYYLKLSSGKTYIPKDSEYRLSGDDLFIISYINNNDETVITAYNGSADTPHIIRPNFDMYSSDHRYAANETPTKEGVANSTYPTEYASSIYHFYTLSSNQEVAYKTYVSDKLDIVRRCYWLTNQVNNRIYWESEGDNYYTYILNDGEYFFYTDSNLTSLFAFGSGTKLKLYAENRGNVFDQNDQSIWTHTNYIDVDTITEQGLTSLGDYFITKTFDTSRFNLEVYENEIITLTSGDTVKFKNLSGEDFSISNNTFIALPDDINVSYKFDGDTEDFTNLPDRSTLLIDDAGWRCRAVLDFNVGPNSPQTLVGNQKITFIPGVYDTLSRRWVAFTDISADYVNGNIELSATNNSTFASDIAIIQGGGADVNLEYMSLDLNYKCPSILIFNSVDNISDVVNLGEGYYSINLARNADISAVVNNACSAISSCEIHTAAVDAESIATTILDGDMPSLANPETNSNIPIYFNNKYYYHIDDDSYYKCVYNDNLNITLTDISQHDMTDLSLHNFSWKKKDSINPSSRLIMIYVNNLNGDNDNILGVNVVSKTLTVKVKNGQNSLPLIKKFNDLSDIDTPSSFTNSIVLQQGINIIEIADTISANINGVETNYCDYLTIEAEVQVEKDLSYIPSDGVEIDEETIKAGARTALASISTLLSKLKVTNGINPALGISENDDIIGYIKRNFNAQFKEFFINAEFDQAKLINISEDYPLSSAQAFYDSNNIANGWIMSKIDFPSSSIKIARSSKK